MASRLSRFLAELKRRKVFRAAVLYSAAGFGIIEGAGLIRPTFGFSQGVIDFIVHLVRARGKRTPKVFKLTRRTLQPGEVLHVEKVFSFQPVTTRKYYPGKHAIEPQINGVTYGSVSFQVG